MNIPNFKYLSPNNGSFPNVNNAFEKIQIKPDTRCSNYIDIGYRKILPNNVISSEKYNIDRNKETVLEIPISKKMTSCFDVKFQTSAHRKIKIIKEKHDIVTEKITPNNFEKAMPLLTKEMGTEPGTKLLKNSPVLNQRYQNVLRFPNYRNRKNSSFKKKLRQCGVVLDGEVTISNLRKLLQPYINQEIDAVLNKYIEVYFTRAFNNIRENVNLTTENWSQTLKCSISKSLYTQYCNIANFDPFNCTSTVDDDFPCFTTFQSSSQKENNVATSSSVKSGMDNSVGHTSDTNSQLSHLSNIEERISIDQKTNAAKISSNSRELLQCNIVDLNGIANAVSRKRNIEVKLDSDSTDNSSKFDKMPCSHRKYSKIVYPTQSYETEHYQSQYGNNRKPLILQVRTTAEPSSSAMESEIYLSTQNLRIINETVNPFLQKKICRNL